MNKNNVVSRLGYSIALRLTTMDKVAYVIVIAMNTWEDTFRICIRTGNSLNSDHLEKKPKKNG